MAPNYVFFVVTVNSIPHGGTKLDGKIVHLEKVLDMMQEKDRENLLFLIRMFYEKKRRVLGTEIRSVCPSFLTWDSKKICDKVKDIGMGEGSSKCIAPCMYLLETIETTSLRQ